MVPSRILAIDDDEGIRRLVMSALEMDYEVHTAASGDEGLALAQRVKPQIILLDLNMPGLDGLTVLARLKSHPETRTIPVIIVSARGESALIAEAQRAGAADQLIKPFTLEQLRAVVRRHVRVEMTQAAPPPPSPRPKTADGAERPVVLAIDDEDGILKLVQRTLEAEYTVWLARDGRQGLAHAQALRPRLIFLDLHLPDLDGLSVLGRLKTDPVTNGIPVVIISARGETEMLLEGQRAGAVDYLIKPFRLDELKAMARRHVLVE